MKKIYAVEMVDQDSKVVFRTPFDIVPYEPIITTIEELEERFTLIEDCITRNCCQTRFWFLSFRHPYCTKRLAAMDWKWDYDFYKNKEQSHGKGPSSDDEAMFKY